eukprot:scaffold35295_cov60-Attheya_sp.AAC.5
MLRDEENGKGVEKEEKVGSKIKDWGSENEMMDEKTRCHTMYEGKYIEWGGVGKKNYYSKKLQLATTDHDIVLLPLRWK